MVGMYFQFDDLRPNICFISNEAGPNDLSQMRELKFDDFGEGTNGSGRYGKWKEGRANHEGKVFRADDA